MASSPAVFSNHTQRVMTLYRRSLRTALNWAVDRRTYNRSADEIRSKFEAHRFEKDEKKIGRLMDMCEQELKDKEHPDPYIVATYPGGSKYQRNIPPPQHLMDENTAFVQWH